MNEEVRRLDASQGGAPGADARLAETAVEELLSELLTQIKAVLAVDTVAVLLLDETTDELVAHAAKGLEEEVEQGVRIPLGKGFAGRIAAERRPLVLEDVDRAFVLNPILREKGIVSMLGVPLEFEDKVLGVLHVGSLTMREFGDSDVRVLELVAGRVSLPIVQSQLYHAEREARERLDAVRRQLTFLAEASTALASSLDYEETLAAVARLAVPELADWCVVDLVDESELVRRVAVVCADPSKQSLADELRQSYPSRPERDEGTSKVLRTASSELVKDVTSDWIDAIAPDEGQRDILRRLDLRSNILVPLVARGRTLGVLTLATAESGRFYDASDLQLAEELASRAALAVDNARLFREAEESLGLLDTLFATAPVGLAFYDPDLRYLRVNEALAAFNGIPPHDHVGKRTVELLPQIGEEIEDHLRQVLETGEPLFELELAGETPASGERFWLASYYPVRAVDGEAIGVGAVVTDLTDRRRWERRLAAQYSVTRILSDAASFDEAVPLILEALCANLDWELGGVWMLGDTGRLRLLDLWHPPSIEPAPFVAMSREIELEPGEGLPGRVLMEGRPEWFADLGREPFFPRAQVAETVGFRSAFVFPILLGQMVLGVVELYSGQRKEPDEELLRMTEAVGSQIGQFVERKRVESESATTRERLSFLAEASELLSSSLDYEATLESVAQLAVPQLADWCVVDILDDDGTLRRLALTHVDPTKVALAEELARRYPEDPEAPQGSYNVVRTGQSELMPEISDDLIVASARDDEHLRLLRDIGLRSYMSVPLMTRDRMLGVISFVTAESQRVYDETDVAFAEELALRASIAIENARLFRNALANEERQRFLAEAGTVLASALDYRETLQSVSELAVPAFADWCIVDVVEDGEIQRVAVAAADPDSEAALQELKERYPPTLDSPQPAARALREQGPVIFEEFDPASLAATVMDEHHLELMTRLAPRSAVAVPLVARGHTVGAMTFAWARSGRMYTAEDLPLAEEIGRRAGLAVDNARLYREAEERAQAALVLTSVGDGVFMLDRQGVVRLWNPAAESITGLAQADVLGGRAEDVVPGWRALAPRIPVAEQPASAAQRPETLPLEVGGRELWLSISGVAVEEGTVYAFRDLTEERVLEKMKSDFVSTISHELRTPLASVYGAALTLTTRQDQLDEEQRLRLLSVISSEADRLAGIVNDVLLASRIDSETLEFSIEHCDALASLTQALDAARAHLPEHLELLMAEPDSPPLVEADPEKLRQVLGNLIENAVKYSPDPGTIEAGMERRSGKLRFWVRDEGMGIPAGERERIFEKFYRLDPELLRGIGGTGLGLYISRELVQRMGGKIWVESDGGPGSTFFFELPLAEPVVARPTGDVTSEARA